MDNNLEDFHPTMEESCGSSESSPSRSTSTKMKRNEWSDSRIIMPFVPLEAIKEEVTPCSSTQRLENNLSVIKNKLRSGSDIPPARFDQRTQLSGETNTGVANCLKLNVVNGTRATANLNYNAHNNLYDIKSKIRKSSSRAAVTARNGTNVNDGRISNIDSSRDASESNDETKIHSRAGNINNMVPAKPARKSVNTSDRNKKNVKTTKGDDKHAIPSSAESRQRSLNHNIVVSKNSTPRSMKFNSCIDELKYYNVRNGLSKNPSEENSARKLSSQGDDEVSNSGLTTSRTDCTDASVSALFNNNKENNSSGNNSTLNDIGKNNSLDVSECNTKDFKYYLMHSDNKTSSTTNSLNLTESEPNSPDTPIDKNTSTRVKKQESPRGTSAKVTKPKTEQEKTHIPKKINTEKVVNKNQSKNLPRTELKYKTGGPKNKLNLNANDYGTKKNSAPSDSLKLKKEVKGKESKYSPVNHEKAEICTSSKSQAVEKYSTQTKFKHETNSSKITKTKVASNDIGDNGARKKNFTVRRRYSMGESSVTNQDKHKQMVLGSSGGQEKTRRVTTYIHDNQNRQMDEPPRRRNDDDCYSKPRDFSLKSSDSLKVVGRRVECCPSTDGIRDYCSEMSDNSKVCHGGNILEMSSRNLFMRQRDADDRQGQLGMGDFSEYSFATMDYCAACNNYSDLSTQDSFSTNTKDTWTQVHFSDIIKEMKMQMKKNKTRAAEEEEEEEEYSSFLKRHATGDNKEKRKARSGNTVRNERTGQYRRGREMNFNYDKPVQNYLINSSRQNTARRFAHDDDTFDCCGCMRFPFVRRIFNRFN